MHRKQDDSLAMLQATVARALTRATTAPDGFDLARIDLARDMLLAKRRRAAMKVLPLTTRELGESFRLLFDNYATCSPSPADPLHDALRFAATLDTRRLSDSACRQIARMRLAAGERCAVIRSQRHIILALRLPLLGSRIIAVPDRVAFCFRKATSDS